MSFVHLANYTVNYPSEHLSNAPSSVPPGLLPWENCCYSAKALLNILMPQSNTQFPLAGRFEADSRQYMLLNSGTQRLQFEQGN